METEKQYLSRLLDYVKTQSWSIQDVFKRRMIKSIETRLEIIKGKSG